MNSSAADGMFQGGGANGVSTVTIRIRDVTDGMTNTAMFGEKLMGIGGTATDNLNFRDTDTPSASVAQVDPSPASAQVYYNACKLVDPRQSTTTLQSAYPQSCFWYNGDKNQVRYSHCMPPNSWDCAWGAEKDGGAMSAMSRHPGGVNITFGDGSVRFIKNSIAIQVWWAVGTIQGGEVVSADAF
jgi:prepilin-type processing-associated H-X9-DG protein